MNRSIDVLKEIYKPYRYTIKGNSTIIESTSGNFVIKPKTKDLKELFDYLNSRSFHNFPKLVDSSRSDTYVFEYLNDISMPQEQRIQDLITLVAKLHNKTSFYKEVSEDKYKSIYEDIKNNILYLKEYYNNLFDISYNDIYLSPSMYLFMRNYTKIKDCLLFCESELDKWYDLVKDIRKQRVSIVHNNLALRHFLRNEESYLISWDKALIDTPILDIVNLYKNEYYHTTFEPILSKYFELVSLHEDEKTLLFIMLSLPWQVVKTQSEFDNCKNYNELLDYIYKTENLIRPYYSKKQEK